MKSEGKAYFRGASLWVFVLGGMSLAAGACGSTDDGPNATEQSSGGSRDGGGPESGATTTPVRHIEIVTDSGRGTLVVDISAPASEIGNPLPAQVTQSIRVDGMLYSLVEATADAQGSANMRVAFGPLVPGVTHAELTLQDGVLSGAYDGRTIVPMNATDDPAALAFQDGRPPPSTQVSDDVKAVVIGAIGKDG